MPLEYAIRWLGELGNLPLLDLVINIYSGASRIRPQEGGYVFTARRVKRLLCGATVFKLVPFSFFGVSVLVPDTFSGCRNRCVLDSG